MKINFLIRAILLTNFLFASFFAFASQSCTRVGNYYSCIDFETGSPYTITKTGSNYLIRGSDGRNNREFEVILNESQYSKLSKSANIPTFRDNSLPFFELPRPPVDENDFERYSREYHENSVRQTYCSLNPC